MGEEERGSESESELRQGPESGAESEQLAEMEGVETSEYEPEPEREPEGEPGARGGHGRESEHGRDSEHGDEGEHGEESGESGTRYGIADTARETRSGVRLALRFDAAGGAFTGTVTNTTTEPVTRVRVEVHLSNGVELGPTPRITLAPGEASAVTLDASGQRFETWETHVEIGEGEHGGEGHRGF